MEPKLIKLTDRGGTQESPIAIEGRPAVPFGIQRAYYIFGTEPDAARWVHALRKTPQMAFCVVLSGAPIDQDCNSFVGECLQQ